MKKLIIILISIILVAYFGSWLSLHFAAKKKFDKARNEINTGILTREIMDAQTRELLTIVRKDWTKHTSEVNGAHSVALKLAGIRPTVSNLVDLFSSRVPEYSFFSLSKNKESAIIAPILAMLLPITVDGTIHVSSDGSLALIQNSANTVHVFTDESEGLREEWYRREKVDIKALQNNKSSKVELTK
jgi:hypothetical protein